MLKISVVIPFYKGEEFFDECIQSVLDQSYPVEEIIVINDSPSESTKDFLSKYDALAKIIHLEKNHGISNARNIGVANCKCDWIAFLDNDDVWVKNKIEKQVEYLEEHRDVAALHTGTKVFSGEEVIEFYVDKPLRLEMKDALLISQVLPSSLIVKKKAIEDVGGFDPNASGSEDREITIKLINNGVLIDFIPEPLVGFRRQGQANYSSFWKPKFKAHWYIFVKHFAQYRKYHKIRPYLNMMFLHAGYKSKGLTSVFFRGLGKLFG